MLYYNTKFKFALPEGAPENLGGGIIAASAMPSGQLVRRIRAGFRKNPYLQHRLFDPQLYLAGLDKLVAPGTVANLATQPWFGKHDVPVYDSETHGTMKAYKDAHEQALLDSWRRTAPTTDDEIGDAVRACVKYQLDLGCEGILLPAPLTTTAEDAYQTETRWLDIGSTICLELRVAVPVYATVAISDTVLRNVNPFKNALLSTITSQIAARAEIAGAYVVLEQTVDSGYACTARDVLAGLLVLADDLTRGAGKRVVVNYVGSFGVVMSAVGATIWTTGYYRSQRRLRFADHEEVMALAQPRFFSFRLAGDVGLHSDLATAFSAGLGKKLLLPTTPGSEHLYQALADGTYPASVPQWEHRSNNLTAASAHYLIANNKMAMTLDSLDENERIDVVRRWLGRAADIAAELKAMGMHPPTTDCEHQAVWLAALDDWLAGRS